MLIVNSKVTMDLTKLIQSLVNSLSKPGLVPTYLQVCSFKV